MSGLRRKRKAGRPDAARLESRPPDASPLVLVQAPRSVRVTGAKRRRPLRRTRPVPPDPHVVFFDDVGATLSANGRRRIREAATRSRPDALVITIEHAEGLDAEVFQTLAETTSGTGLRTMTIRVERGA